jgi:hypothetical protein
MQYSTAVLLGVIMTTTALMMMMMMMMMMMTMMHAFVRTHTAVCSTYVFIAALLIGVVLMKWQNNIQSENDGNCQLRVCCVAVKECVIP